MPPEQQQEEDDRQRDEAQQHPLHAGHVGALHHPGPEQAEAREAGPGAPQLVGRIVAHQPRFPARHDEGPAGAGVARTGLAAGAAPLGIDQGPLQEAPAEHDERRQQQQRQRAHGRRGEPGFAPAQQRRRGIRRHAARLDQGLADVAGHVAEAATPSCRNSRRLARLTASAMTRLIVTYSSTTSAIASSAWLVWLSTVPPTICMMSG